ncbi:Acyl-coenzyme A oxidase [Quadrisphaera granulorum]|uniref:acyl-CoA oxidase n=1 Tax=Quadrisphaera granulorum TaxID=317664 RepID=A0A316AAJ5_9ACTN|nr:acyl-CoA dehydrogenase [Quadrisphaera granulorum]PWJ54641.1 acyl-coenzyme A oxidase [Quadrisphaera granulorum]SZE96003.1 Acyl-coenzyme A oxidase [Quadrisphaera granulorum]
MSTPTAESSTNAAAADAADVAAGVVESSDGSPSRLDGQREGAAGHVWPVDPAQLAADPRAVQKVLDGRWAAVRDRARATLPAAWCQPTDHLSTEEHRTVTLDRLREIVATGEHRYGFAASATGGLGGDSVGAQTVNFEMLGHTDLSLTIKAGVQWGLFAGSIQALGTAKHHEKYLRDAVELDLLGCFAMTETGHGSDVANLRTTATYDEATGEFVVHSPGPEARKDYIGNAARDARMAVVYAQLVTKGERHGVHAVLVPIRDEAGNALPGVTLSDCGRKMGLNGVDNGRIMFDHVRVPRENLLDRYGQVAQDGTYTSSISNANARFFTTLGALVKGRVCIGAAALAAAKTGLAIAVTYAERRQQFPKAGGEMRDGVAEEVTLLDYRTHQRRLLPLLASSAVYALAQDDVVAELHRVTNPVLLGAAPTPGPQKALEAKAAGMKALLTWHATRSLQEAREACGGSGFLSENRIAQLKGDTDVFTTFEGDNTVLLQLLAKHLLSEHRDALKGAGKIGQAKAVTTSLVDAYAGRTPARAVAGFVGEVVTDISALRQRGSAKSGAAGSSVGGGAADDADPELFDRTWQLRMLEHRERRTLESLALRMRKRAQTGASGFSVMNEVQDHLVLAARTHLDAWVARTADAAISRADDELAKVLLSRLLDLHVLTLIEADRAWYLERGLITAGRSRELTTAVNALCAQVRPHALRVVDAFGLPEGWLGAHIAS